MTKTRIVLFSLILLVLPVTVLAFEAKAGNSIYVGTDETSSGTLYAAGSNVTVDGTVEGDVICAGQSININGTVEGDVICAGQSINISGLVKGSVRLAGQSINISGTVEHGAQTLGANIILGSEGSLGWDMLIAGAVAEVRGLVGGDLHGAAGNVTISGTVGGDVKLRLDERAVRSSGNDTLLVEDGAQIGGNLYYVSGAPGNISDNAVIAGETGFSPSQHKEKKPLIFGWFGGLIYSIFAAMVIGLVIINLWRKHLEAIIKLMQERTNSSLMWGIGITFLTPFIVLFLFFTLIGLPLGLMLIAIWLILMYAAKLLTAILIGKKLLAKIRTGNSSLLWSMIAGVIVSWIVFALPLFGWLFALLATWWAVGAILLYFKRSQ